MSEEKTVWVILGEGDEWHGNSDGEEFPVSTLKYVGVFDSKESAIKAYEKEEERSAELKEAEEPFSLNNTDSRIKSCFCFSGDDAYLIEVPLQTGEQRMRGRDTSTEMEPIAKKDPAITINLVQLFGEHCITAEQGKKLLAEIEPYILAGEGVAIDLAGVKRLLPPFLNNSIGLLLKQVDRQQMDYLLSVNNQSPFHAMAFYLAYTDADPSNSDPHLIEVCERTLG